MRTLPTPRELEDAGKDAGALLDACESELERSISTAANKSDKGALADDLKQVRKLRAEWFGGAA